MGLDLACVGRHSATLGNDASAIRLGCPQRLVQRAVLKSLDRAGVCLVLTSETSDRACPALLKRLDDCDAACSIWIYPVQPVQLGEGQKMVKQLTICKSQMLTVALRVLAHLTNPCTLHELLPNRSDSVTP